MNYHRVARNLILPLFLIWLSGELTWANGFSVPSLREAVQDDAGLLSPQGHQTVSSLLQEVRQKGGPQIQIWTVSSLEGTPIEEASIQVVQAWKLGDEKKDNGILFIIARKERKLRIEVGQGLEGELPDVVAKRIISRVVSPFFKAGEIDRGVLEGVLAILGIVGPEYLQGYTGELGKDSEPQSRSVPSSAFVLILFFGLFLLRLFSGRSSPHARGFGGGGWGGGGWGGGSSGGGWSGGGGGFSGGGASGDW